MNEETEKGTEKSTPKGAEEERSRILEFGSVVTKNGVKILSLVIAGQIEGHLALQAPAKSTKYEHIIPQLIAAEEDAGIDGVLILLNTVGGDVEAGLAMAELIRGMKKPCVSLVLGGGHSIGIPLAVAAKESFIAPSATMTVHPVRINGLVLGVPQSFEYLRRMQERVSEFIVENSHISRRELDRLMDGRADMATDIGSILEGREAAEVGLIDRVGCLSDALDALKAQIKNVKKE